MVFSISIVTFHTPPTMLEALWRTMAEASRTLATAGYHHQIRWLLVDNSVPSDPGLEPFVREHVGAVELLSGHGNIGYGRGHNLALAHVTSDFHIVLNADVEFAPDTLLHAMRFMQEHRDCGLLVPAVFEENGRQQFLCKRYPSVFDLFLRGFGPRWLARRFQGRLDRYEMRDLMHDQVVWNPTVVSGCFMLFRTAVLKELGGFDPSFFLYFEDFDLAIRSTRVTRVAYVPQVSIVHYGGNAARKGVKHVRMFAGSAFRFYNKHGWKWL